MLSSKYVDIRPRMMPLRIHAKLGSRAMEEPYGFCSEIGSSCALRLYVRVRFASYVPTRTSWLLQKSRATTRDHGWSNAPVLLRAAFRQVEAGPAPRESALRFSQLEGLAGELLDSAVRALDRPLVDGSCHIGT